MGIISILSLISHNGNYDFYVRILLYTKSMFIDHSYNNPNSNQVSEIAYSKLKILKIISPLQWGNCWLNMKTIKQVTVTFTYYDWPGRLSCYSKIKPSIILGLSVLILNHLTISQIGSMTIGGLPLALIIQF